MKQQTEGQSTEPAVALRRLYVVGIDPGAERGGRRRAVAVPLKRLAGLSRVKRGRGASKPAEG
jgi:hypothetical protein